ncbi:Hypothetical protein (Fragment) [Durusdinium trenchii]|uniref:Uncharacterized protein n=1 Tax=Durusdinium trenchii TaxID=1381693 RepID=A0ABP0H9B1_9DINO
MLHVCWAVSGALVTSWTAEELEGGASVKALKARLSKQRLGYGGEGSLGSIPVFREMLCPPSTVQLLLLDFWPPDVKLISACAENHCEEVEALLQKPVLIQASAQGITELTRDPRIALDLAAMFGQLETVQLLLQAYRDHFSFGDLWSAYASGAEVVKNSDEEKRDVAFAEKVWFCRCHGCHGYEASEEANPGFFQRLEGSLLSVLHEGPSRAMATVGPDGSLELQEEHLPEEVRRLFPDIWSFLQTGRWEAKVSAKGLWDLRKALSFLNLKAQHMPADEREPVIFVHKHMLTLPQGLGPDESPLALSWLEGPPRGKAYALHGGSDLQINQTGALTLSSDRGSVKLESATGALYLKLPESTNYVWVATNRALRGKQMHSMLLRKSVWDPEVNQQLRRFNCQRGEGYLLLIQLRPKNRDSKLETFVSWPGFWFMAELEVIGPRHELFKCHTQDLRPGGVATLEDGSILWLSNPDSLRKSRLTIFRAEESFRVFFPGIVVNLVAPKAFDAGVRLVKGRGKGRGYEGTTVGGLRTLHPQGRAPASVWVVQRPQQLVVLIHAADRRVAVAQLRGPGGPQPNLLEAHRYQPGQPGCFWDVWCRHDSSTFGPPHVHRMHTRGKFDVPMCEQVLAVVPCEVGLLIFHRQMAKSLPSCWCVRLGGEPEAMQIQRHWYNDQWCCSGQLPDDIMGRDSRAPVFLAGQGVEFLRWQLTHEPPDLHQLPNHLIPPIGLGGRPDVIKGSSKGKTNIFWPWSPCSPGGGPFLEHWKTQLEL